MGTEPVKSSYDVIIIGAGIVGAACARACAQSGLSVLVLERSHIAGEATASGMGHVVVMDDSEAQFALSAYSRTLWQELAQSAPSQLEYEPRGTLWVATDEEEMTEVRRKQAFYCERGIATEQLDAQALAEAEPNLRNGLVGGLCVLEDAVVYPPAVAAFLLAEAKRSNAELRTHAAVKSIASGNVYLADGTELSAGAVVNAAGCGAPELTPDLPIRPRKGHLVITESYPQFAHHQIIELGYLKSAHSFSTESVAFNIQPRQTGQLLIGSSRQFDSSDREIDYPLLKRMLDQAIQYMPSLSDLSALRCWTGFRPASPDKLPYIGPHPLQDKLWLACGHEGLGITTSMATGQIIADLLSNRTPEIPIDPYLPQRLWQTEKEACDV